MRKLTTLAAACLIALAGCSSSDGSHGQHGGDGSTGESSATEEFNEADVMFAQMMIPHHEQAIEMADLAPDRTDNAELLALASEIKNAQGPEIEQLQGWLDDWNQPATPDGDGGMDHGDMGDGGGMGDHGGMDGMLSDEQLDELKSASGEQFDQLWLEYMIAHHEGAIAMAQQQVDSGKFAPAVEMAEAIITSQSAEITAMQEMLAR